MTGGLSPRAAKYLETCDEDDPVVMANRLIDRAQALQDEGNTEEADRLLADAEMLMEGEPT